MWLWSARSDSVFFISLAWLFNTAAVLRLEPQAVHMQSKPRPLGCALSPTAHYCICYCWLITLLCNTFQSWFLLTLTLTTFGQQYSIYPLQKSLLLASSVNHYSTSVMLALLECTCRCSVCHLFSSLPCSTDCYGFQTHPYGNEWQDFHHFEACIIGCVILLWCHCDQDTWVMNDKFIFTL